MEDSSQNKNDGYEKKSIWQLIIIYLIIGGLVYWAIYYFAFAKKGGQQYNAPSSTSQSESTNKVQQTTNTITLSDNGFSPETLTIKVGTKATWVNKSGRVAAVNSDPHPTHTAYAPLNLGKLMDGEMLSLIFNKAGTYKYHNHLDSSQTGTLIVK